MSPVVCTIPSRRLSKIKHNGRFFRAFLHGGGGPQVGEVTRLAVVEKQNASTYNLTTPLC